MPFSAGGSNDTVARLICPVLAKALGQQVIVRTLNAEISRIVEAPDTSKRFAALGINPSTKSMRWHLAELAKWKDVVARVKIPLEN